MVSTKVGRYGQEKFDFSAARVKKSVDESLARLGLDHVELCICHDVEFGDIDQIVQETIPALKELQREGKIKHIGVSGLPLELFRHLIEKGSKDIDFILSYCHYTMFDTTLHTLWDEKLQKLGLGVINASPLSMGLLTKGGPPAWHPAPENVKSVCKNVASYCSLHGVDISEMALNYSMQASFPASTLVGIQSAEMAEQNVKCLHKQFPDDVLSWAKDQFDTVRDISWSSGLPRYNTKS